MTGKVGFLYPAVLIGSLAFAAPPAGAEATHQVLKIALSREPLASMPAELSNLDAIQFTAAGVGRWETRLLPTNPMVASLPEVDLRLLVPRIPKLAAGDAGLARLALIQREFNRNEIHYDAGNGLDFSIANNCLRRGLWEVKIAKKEQGKTTMIFHAWFDFPADAYARLFQDINGRPYSDYASILDSYPELNGLPVSLGALRSVLAEASTSAIDTHSAQGLGHLSEQDSKRKLVLSPGIATYGDFCTAAHQPVTLSRFAEPGAYTAEKPATFDLAWLSSPRKVTFRRVRSAASSGDYPEVEIAFANGTRILLADSRLDTLPQRNGPPAGDGDVLKLVCGLETPDIQATAADRARELAEERPRYLMLLDASGKHLDNHKAGIDGVYVWREAGDPGSLHLWLVSYERIAFVAHLSAPWQVPPAGGR